EGGGAAAAVSLLVLLSSGVLLHFRNLGLARLGSELQPGGTAFDLEGVLQDFRSSVVLSPIELPEDARCFTASSALHGRFGEGTTWQTTLHVCGSDALFVYRASPDGSFRLQDQAPLPVTSPREEFSESTPSKRRRLSREPSCAKKLQVDDVACFASWPGLREVWGGATSSQCEEDVLDEHFVGWANEEEALLVLALRSPGLVAIFDAALLVEISSWAPPGGADIVSAAILGVALPSSSQGANPTPSRVALDLCLVLGSGELLVASFPAAEVRFSIGLGAGISSAV
ncbi:unnamed protein product, partial [Polarella glacialis]